MDLTVFSPSREEIIFDILELDYLTDEQLRILEEDVEFTSLFEIINDFKFFYENYNSSYNLVTNNIMIYLSLVLNKYPDENINLLVLCFRHGSRSFIENIITSYNLSEQKIKSIVSRIFNNVNASFDLDRYILLNHYANLDVTKDSYIQHHINNHYDNFRRINFKNNILLRSAKDPIEIHLPDMLYGRKIKKPENYIFRHLQLDNDPYDSD